MVTVTSLTWVLGLDSRIAIVLVYGLLLTSATPIMGNVSLSLSSFFSPSGVGMGKGYNVLFLSRIGWRQCN